MDAEEETKVEAIPTPPKMKIAITKVTAIGNRVAVIAKINDEDSWTFNLPESAARNKGVFLNVIKAEYLKIKGNMEKYKETEIDSLVGEEEI